MIFPLPYFIVKSFKRVPRLTCSWAVSVEVGGVNFASFVSKLWQSYLALGTLTYFFFYILRVFLMGGYGLTTGTIFLPVFKVLLSGFGKKELIIL